VKRYSQEESVATSNLRSKRKRSGRTFVNNEHILHEGEDDICCVCGEMWISVDGQTCDDQSDLEETMIICDECEGSFHMMCVGECFRGSSFFFSVFVVRSRFCT
jgi:hypothetical protein